MVAKMWRVPSISGMYPGLNYPIPNVPAPIPRVPSIGGMYQGSQFPTPLPVPVPAPSGPKPLPLSPGPIPGAPTPTPQAPAPMPQAPAPTWPAAGLRTQLPDYMLEGWYTQTPSGLEDWAAGNELALLRLINNLIPSMGIEDISTAARYLYTATGGAQGPFAAYANVPTAGYPDGWRRQEDWQQYRQTPRLSEYTALQEARSVVEGAGLDAGTRDWILGAIDLGQDLTRPSGLGERPSFARTREQQIRLESELESYLQAAPTEEARPWAQWLSRLILPTRVSPMPGAISYTPGTRQGYSILPNPRFY